MKFADTTRRSIPETEREKIQNEWNTVRHNPGPEIGDMIHKCVYGGLNGHDMIQADTNVLKSSRSSNGRQEHRCHIWRIRVNVVKLYRKLVEWWLTPGVLEYGNLHWREFIILEYQATSTKALRSRGLTGHVHRREV